MRFYNQSHAAYCGVDLHARTQYLQILDDRGSTRSTARVPEALSIPTSVPLGRPRAVARTSNKGDERTGRCFACWRPEPRADA
jgi:hypothetical protein